LIWPSLGITKLELARYIGEVGEWMLPQVANRPAHSAALPGRRRGEVLLPAPPRQWRPKKGEYLFINSIPAVVSLAQCGVVEMHTWGVTLPDARHPDRITLDLDPDPELPWEKLRAATVLTADPPRRLKLKAS